VFKRGIRDSGTFPNRQQAMDWIIHREAAINALVDTAGHTFGDAIRKRIATEGLSRWDILRLQSFPQSWQSLPIVSITPEVIAKWRDERLKEVKPGTVLRERTVLRSLFAVARQEWKWVTVNPVADVKPPKSPQPRRRLIDDDERDAILQALGFNGVVENIRHETAVAFLVALETGMRAGEILALLPEHVQGNVAHIARSKMGPARDVALSKRAVELFQILARKQLLSTTSRTTRRVFHISSGSLDTTFRRARKSAGLQGFTFHDSRATAITRLSKKLDPRQLARMVGHSDLNSLMIYYAESASETAAQLD
jgi:integrase